MAKKGSGGWVRRRKNGNSTTTYNTNKGSTYSYSIGGRSNRWTTTRLPDGKTRYTHTTRNGDWVKRETRTEGGPVRFKKNKLRIRKNRVYRGKNSLSFSGLFFIIFFFIIIAAIFSK